MEIDKEIDVSSDDGKGLKKNCPRSGQIAVGLEFITIEQLKEAISEQLDDDLSKKPHRFLGEILLDKGWISLEQLDIIIDELFKEEMRSKGKL